MPRITVNIGEDVEEWLEEESDRLNWSKAKAGGHCIELIRSEAGRINMMQSGSNHDSRSDSRADLRDRVDELEQRLADLESGGVDAGGETAPSVRREAGHERGEEPADPVVTADAGGHEPAAGGDDDAGDVPDVIKAAIERAAESWDDDDARTEARKAAAQAVLEALRDEPMSRSEIVDEFADEYAVAGQNDDTWWRKNLAECPDAPLKALASYDAGSQQWRWSGAE